MKRWRHGTSLRDHGRLVPPHPDDQLVTASITPDGSAVALWAGQAAAADLANLAGTAFVATLDRPVTARVTVQEPDGQQRTTTTITDLKLAHPDIAVLPSDELLVVGARCNWTPDHVDPNAVVYSTDGHVIRQAVVGDGIAHLRTTASGAIWIGYSDEGIFGNFGWGSPGPAPLGHRGLLRFDRSLEASWEFPEIRPDIADLDAINVVGETVWMSYYTDYPIARVDNDSVTIWATNQMTINQLLVDHDRLALIGDHVVLAHLDTQRVIPTATTQLQLPAATSAGPPHVIAQGPVLHVITPDGRWSITDIETLEATAF